MMNSVSATSAEHDTAESTVWTPDAVLSLYEMPFADLLFRAQQVHRRNFDPNTVQLSALLSIKTGACPEDCAYCPQSARYSTGVVPQKLLELEEIVAAARQAKQQGASRFCMGAAWREPKQKDLAQVAEAIKAVKALGMETCATLGMLTMDQAKDLKAAGLDYYNHNLDTSPEYYGSIVSTRTYQERLDTLERVSASGMNVCCGGIIGMGETREDRAAMLAVLAELPEPPKSVPINMLVQAPGTPLHGTSTLDPLEFVRTVAAARITMPESHVRLSAGRDSMSEETQALCFLAGANSVFYGEKLLTTDNKDANADRALFAKLGIRPQELSA